MAVLICRSSCSHLSATTAVFCLKRLVSHHIDGAVAFTYSARSPLRLFGFHADVQCHRAEIWSRLEGVGQVPWG